MSEQQQQPYSIVKPVGFTIASCGYCHSDNSAHVYGAFAYKLTCQDYQNLIDHGWRRLNASEFKPSKGQRRTVARINRYMRNQYVPLKISRESMVREDTSALDEHSPSPEPPHGTAHGPRRKSLSPPLGRIENSYTDFLHTIHATDMDKMEPGSDWKQFKVVLEPARFTQEKYDLYCEYQKGIHHVSSALLSRESFDNSVARSPLISESPIQDTLGFNGYGTYHQCYYVDNKLVAVAVLDILPRCISSDYFYYDPSLSSLSLGKYSTLREIALVQDIKAIPGYELMEYYTMGHYVHSAPKTHYKTMYHPSFLLDPESYDWTPFEKCEHILQSKRYYSFSESERFHPRVKGLLITMAAERRAREKSSGSKGSSPSSNDCSHMELDSSTEVEVEGLSAQNHLDHALSSSDEEGHKRKRSNEFSHTPKELMRSGKRPSLTSPSSDSLLPPPGMMNPDDVTDRDLSQLVVFQGDRATMLTDSESFKNNKDVAKAMRDYYAAIGPTLAPRMLIFA
ncbi:Arginyl-tRNA--protein transferase 1 [Linnemannia hyalina]|uniref:Arginyl-tRNA--protein transferase 1 n=1 Tax=Linnemannia hyalina TaxID=64524 RepID=A0A9P7XTD5_9FUNG|nr:Arginyl-tRNA--protein transferase 1 [Linnemannia hyalina]